MLEYSCGFSHYSSEWNPVSEEKFHHDGRKMDEAQMEVRSKSTLTHIEYDTLENGMFDFIDIFRLNLLLLPAIFQKPFYTGGEVSRVVVLRPDEVKVQRAIVSSCLRKKGKRPKKLSEKDIPILASKELVKVCRKMLVNVSLLRDPIIVRKHIIINAKSNNARQTRLNC